MLAGATVISLAGLISGSSAQLAKAPTDSWAVRLQRRGFTAADFAAFQTTQVTPHFERFVQWRRCATAIVPGAIAIGANEAAAREFGRLGCTESADLVRASIAREIGVGRAMRVKQMLDAQIDEAIHVRWPNERLKNERVTSNPLTGPVQIGRWTIEPQSGGCIARFRPNARSAPRLAIVQTGKFLQLWLGSTEVLWTAQDPPPMRRVTVEGRSGSTDFSGSFRLKYEPGVIWLYAPLYPQDITALADATKLSLHIDGPRFPPSTGEPETFAIDPVAPILETLENC